MVAGRESRGVEFYLEQERVNLFSEFFLHALVAVHIPTAQGRTGQVRHFENLGIGNVTFHTAIRHCQCIVTGFQVFTPQFVVHRGVNTISEEFLRFGQNAVGCLLQVDAISTRTLFNVQTDASLGAFASRRYHVVRTYRSVKTVPIRRRELHVAFEVHHLRLFGLIFEDRCASGDLISAGFQTDEGLRFSRLRRFSHVGVLRARYFLQRVVHLVYIVEGFGQNHRDFTVVLTLHLIDACVETKGGSRRRIKGRREGLVLKAAVEHLGLDRKTGGRLFHLDLRCFGGRHRLIEDFVLLIVRHHNLHCRTGSARVGSHREDSRALRAEARRVHRYCHGTRIGGDSNLLSVTRSVVEVVHIILNTGIQVLKGLGFDDRIGIRHLLVKVPFVAIALIDVLVELDSRGLVGKPGCF